MYEDSIPDFIKTIINTYEKIVPKQATKLEVKELTGRISHYDVPKTLEEVGIKLDDNNQAIDALLCTSMLSVGVDIDRLSVLLVNGQPGSTSEYIQATGRVGRAYPGLVVTNYTYSHTRDLSYFENFLQFHTTFHKHVEPGTLTPFSARARDRGLFGVFVALIRLGSRMLSENPERFQRRDPEVSKLVDDVKSIILARVEHLDPAEKLETESDLESYVNKWDRLSTRHNAGEIKLRYRPPIFVKRDAPKNEIYLLNSSRDYNQSGFVIPESLREAESEVATYYIKDRGPSGDDNG
jgi:superfamily II DNA/RNA helicase